MGQVMESDQLQKGIRERDQLQRRGHGKRPTTEDDMERNQLQRGLFFSFLFLIILTLYKAQVLLKIDGY